MVFGRCPTFTIVEVEAGTIRGVSVQQNTAMMTIGGAGILAARLLGRLGIKAAMAGNFGPNAFAALSALGISVVQVQPGITVREAVERYLRGETRPVAALTAPSFKGMFPTPRFGFPVYSKESEIALLDAQKAAVEGR